MLSEITIKTLKEPIIWPDEYKVSFFRLSLLLGTVFLLLLFLNKASVFVVLSLLVITFAYIYLKPHLWILLAFSIPALSLGKIINVPVTNNWIYEARPAELILGLAVIVFLLDVFLKKKESEIRFTKSLLALSIFLSLSILSFVNKEDFRLFIFGLKVVAFSFLGYFLALNLVNSRKKIEIFIYALCLTSLVLSSQLFFKFYSMGFSSKFFFERNIIEIPIGPIAVTSAILALILPVILSVLLKKDAGVNKFFVFAAFLAGATAVFLSLGKGAILSLLAGLFFVFMRTKHKVPILLFGSWFLVISYLLFNPFFKGLFERVHSTFVDVNTEFRLLEYKTGWQLIKQNPLFGIGAGQQLYKFPQLINVETGNFVNNYFLQSAIDLGIIGFAVIAYLTKSVYQEAGSFIRERNSILAVGFGASFIAAFINGMVEVTFFALPYALIFWPMAGVFHNLDKYE